MLFFFIPEETLELEGTGSLELEGTGNLILESSGASAGVAVYDDLPRFEIEYRYQLDYFSFQMEPSDQVNPHYLEAWHNLPTFMMPEFLPEHVWGDIYNWPSTFMQISTPIFPPNATPPTTQTTLVVLVLGKANAVIIQ